MQRITILLVALLGLSAWKGPAWKGPAWKGPAWNGPQQEATEEPHSVLDYVDPNIGTAHSRWFFYTPAAVPFGMAKLGPSTNGSEGNEQGWEAVGYDARHTSIEGFANLHEFQVGGFLFMATTGKLQTVPGPRAHPEEGYRSRFNKEDVQAAPGFYQVVLKDYGITAALTATKRVGFQQYTFPATDSAYILLDVGNQLGESGKVKDAYVSYREDNTIEGWVITYPEYVKKYQPGGEVRMYFSGLVDKKPTAVGTFSGATQYEGQTRRTGPGAGLYLRFETQPEEAVLLKVGFSYTSVENARKNLEAEAQDLSFQQAKQRAQQTWTNELSKIRVSGSTPENKTKFYTGLFHALLGRGLASDVNGQFPQNDGTIGHIPLDETGTPTYNFYNTDSVWGAFWNLTQLWALVWPDYYNDFVQTQLAVYKNAGWLGDGIANSKFVSGVGTNFVGLIMASAYQCGIRDYDVELAFEAAYKNEVTFAHRIEGAGKTDLKGFVENGYVAYLPGWNTSTSGSGFSVSHTLEYCYSSYAVAQFAKALGKKKEYQTLMQLSENWKNLYDKTADFVKPKLPSGQFIEEFDPYAPWIGFQEGNAWQYTFYVPHDPKGLIAHMGEEKFVHRLDSVFTVSEKTEFGGKDIDAFAGLTYLYNQGNQPNLHIPWLFNFTDHPWLTQKWVREICNQFYGTEEIHGYGYGQDEDQGQLGAWYVMAAIGLFDVKGLVETAPSFQFSSPLFDRIEIATGGREPLVIETSGNAPDHPYIQAIQLNGASYTDRQIPLKTLKKGAHLKFHLGAQPNRALY
ncbi:alpha-1,2-mannosidase, putative [Catalinimonas alkaloidigena]|uniref:Alpha-1,2-mannosidase, putative n=1 Tax=Catalinimonas alkaloidigena TaxID=1075417 RepID=A0A1G9TNV6_9BACT|nr:GH92 family glycosyl hydrolase [Catalinimonas alkaloidigena]SDM49373.1 alpha-1,2-mannosidase, putative [Catalinimonas alkaloidigena]